MSPTFHLDPADADWLREHLVPIEGVEPVRIRRELKRGTEEYERREAAIQAQTTTFLAALEPLLVEAAAKGTYVGVRQDSSPESLVLPTETREFVHWWAPALKRLRESGTLTQMVVREHARGATVMGYRRRPDGDERESIELSRLRLEHGRCGKCGKSRDESDEPCISGGVAKTTHEFASGGGVQHHGD